MTHKAAGMSVQLEQQLRQSIGAAATHELQRRTGMGTGAMVKRIAHKTGEVTYYGHDDTDMGRGDALKQAIAESGMRDTIILSSGSYTVDTLGTLTHTLQIVSPCGPEPCLINFTGSIGVTVPAAASNTYFEGVVISEPTPATKSASRALIVDNSDVVCQNCRFKADYAVEIKGNTTNVSNFFGVQMYGRATGLYMNAVNTTNGEIRCHDCDIFISLADGENTESTEPVGIYHLEGGDLWLLGCFVRSGSTHSTITTTHALFVSGVIAQSQTFAGNCKFHSTSSGANSRDVKLIGNNAYLHEAARNLYFRLGLGQTAIDGAPSALFPSLHRDLADPNPVANTPQGYIGEIAVNTDNSVGNAGVFWRKDATTWVKIG